MQVEKKIFKFINCHISEVVLCVMFIYLALYEIFYAYCDYVYISKDSSNYLREASALVRGDGFYYNRLAGYDNWFAAWPIGYPALIALFSFITRHNIYLSSKLLGIALVGIGLIILYLRFKKEAWIYSLVYLNIGFLTLYKYTWSENPFILCLIIWGLSLSEIVERDEPEKKWYFIVMLSMLGAFLSRYFGIVTIMFTGFCLFLYIAYYLFKNRDPKIFLKIKRLFCVEFISSMLVIFYLAMNKINAGTISGTDRLDKRRWHDNYPDLISNLYDALTKEIFNATRIDFESLSPGLSTELKSLLLFLLLFMLGYFIVKQIRKRKTDYRIVFIGAGLFYYFVFIIVRFYSYMDPFGDRFFSPGSMLISIGLLGYLKGLIDKMGKKLPLVICVFLLILCGGILQNIKTYTMDSTAYKIFYKDITAPYDAMPEKTMIINFDGAYQAKAFRPDIMFDGELSYSDTVETLAQKYKQSSEIWIKRDALNNVVRDENYDNSIREYFAQFYDENSDTEEYIQILVLDENTRISY